MRPWGADPYLSLWDPISTWMSVEDALYMLVDNPDYHPDGDFAFGQGKVQDEGERKLTFSGIGIYRPELFASIAPGAKARLAPLLREQMAAGRVGGEHHRGLWLDIGTPQRLQELDGLLRNSMQATQSE